MKKTKKLIIIAVCVIIAVCSAVGTTVAYIFDKTNENVNTFEPVFVSCEVNEDFDGTVKSNVTVENTGDVDAYIRATFVVMWTSDTGSVYSATPVANTDYSVTLTMDKWALGTDGFYYYTLPVTSGASTDVLIGEIRDLGTAPGGYNLTVHVAATAIQAEPKEAIEGVWGVTVNGNGTLSAP